MTKSAESGWTDKRLLARAPQGAAAPAAEEELADLAERVQQPGAEALEKLREELVAEAQLRAERIRRSLEEPHTPQLPRPPVTPIDLED